MHLLKSLAAITLVTAPLSTAAVALQPARTARLEEQVDWSDFPWPDVIEFSCEWRTKALFYVTIATKHPPPLVRTLDLTKILTRFFKPALKQATETAEDKVNSRTYANHEIAEHYGSALSRPDLVVLAGPGVLGESMLDAPYVVDVPLTDLRSTSPGSSGLGKLFDHRIYSLNYTLASVGITAIDLGSWPTVSLSRPSRPLLLMTGKLLGPQQQSESVLHTGAADSDSLAGKGLYL
ncbi:hypothetical protein FALBO_13662 [Fusarium albosuccineum]|uniref:Uncharacterized protein n=1 Tax=Fusarium albosuccineum TaxID=1237068 RepID=A0A8H4KYD4_9HYPO|nr:hypothetical protein FALBO_13662 [Fusarium albosuccineum]